MGIVIRQNSFSSGVVPQQWRQAVVTPVPKVIKPSSLFIYFFMYICVRSQYPPVSAVVYAAADRWAQCRSSGAVVTV